LYGPEQTGTAAGSGDEEGDIEAEIKKELAEIAKPTTKPMFTSVKLDTQCCEYGQLAAAFSR
jgi:tRNA acetyltransferase TAN1